ncbi:PQQ-binding-like beta-propeller repeat protein [Streptomyces niveus]|uniref:outer membrane protein assembly factor BamB family protein n=1 Tax=Streptomyces niveus TaxID=193462 RepID=UPI0034419A42
MTGKTRWSIEPPDGAGYPVISGPDIVYIAGAPVIALDASDGTQLWTYTDERAPNTSVQALLVDDALFVYGDRGVDRVDAFSGKRLWRSQLNALFGIALSGGELYTTYRGGLDVLNAADGAQRRTFSNDYKFAFDVAVTGRSLCYADGDFVHGLDTLTGRTRWQVGPFEEIPYFSELRDGVLAASTYDGKVCLIEAATGTVRWWLHGTGRTSTPVLSGGVVYVAVEHQGVLALDTVAPASKSSTKS